MIFDAPQLPMKAWLSLGIATLLTACGDGNDEQPRAIIANAFAADRAVVNARYADHEFEGPYLPGDTSDRSRVRSGLRFAYALTAHGWDGEGELPVAEVVRSLGETEALAEKTVTITFDESSTWEKCSGMQQDEYELVATTFFQDYPVAAFADVQCDATGETAP